MAAGKVTTGVKIDGSLWLVPPDEDTTESTTTTSTTTTVAPDNNDDSTTTTTETTTEATTTTVATTTEATTTTATTTTDATTETTTRTYSSSGGGGGGSSRSKTTTTTTTEATTEVTTDADVEPTTSAVVSKLEVNPPVDEVRGDHGFVDLGNYGWADEAINSLYKLGIINGIDETHYGPALGCKRGDFAIIINNCLGLDMEPTKNFDDNVDPSKYYYDACRVGYTAGVLSGYGDNTYKPEKYCSREEMFVLVAKTLELLGEDVTSTDLSVNEKYNDAEDIAWWAAPYCAFLTDNGIIGGTAAGNAEPKRNINRAEMAVMMYKDYQYVVSKYGKLLEVADDVTADETEATDTAVDEEESTEDTTAESTLINGRGKSKIRVNSDTTTSTSSDDESDEETEE
jgi:hypothetical protein